MAFSLRHMNELIECHIRMPQRGAGRSPFPMSTAQLSTLTIKMIKTSYIKHQTTKKTQVNTSKHFRSLIFAWSLGFFAVTRCLQCPLRLTSVASSLVCGLCLGYAAPLLLSAPRARQDSIDLQKIGNHERMVVSNQDQR